ncbi:unnamed protein product [Mytilus coruscus]|uniref:Uncharacterized protein n=1 Tax=Mytilus coruscus TaxID=42192 RepID=A0A6J8DN72_MYTCO|nr:unnamed protein product [Mytilus coruscus]
MKAINIVLLFKLFSLVVSDNCGITFRQTSVICDCQSQYRKLIPDHCPKNTTDLLLANNNMGILRVHVFTKYTQLRHLDVSNCSITAIEKLAFGNLVFLESLNLFLNPIKEFKSNLFASIGGLQYLSIPHYLLSTYPEGSWSDLVNLTTVMTMGGLSNKTFAPVFSAIKRLDYFRHFCDYDGSAIQKMKYKNCLENLDLARNNFDIHQAMVITYYTLFSNLKRIDLFQMDGNRHFKILNYHYVKRTKNLYFPDQQTKLDNRSNYRKADVLFRLPASLEFVNASFIGHHGGHSPNSITFTGIKHMKMFDLTGTTTED